MKRKQIIMCCLIAIMAVAAFCLETESCKAAEDQLVKAWVLCKPGSQVNIRRTPDKKGQEIGFLEVGDWFMTDAVSKNGYIRVYGVGDYGEGWIYCGYVATEEPAAVFERYVCVAKTQVACRRWMDGPQIAGAKWLKNGSNVDVFYIADGWAVTSRGYIVSEWLEADPR